MTPGGTSAQALARQSVSSGEENQSETVKQRQAARQGRIVRQNRAARQPVAAPPSYLRRITRNKSEPPFDLSLRAVSDSRTVVALRFHSGLTRDDHREAGSRERGP